MPSATGRSSPLEFSKQSNLTDRIMNRSNPHAFIVRQTAWSIARKVSGVHRKAWIRQNWTPAQEAGICVFLHAQYQKALAVLDAAFRETPAMANTPTWHEVWAKPIAAAHQAMELPARNTDRPTPAASPYSEAHQLREAVQQHAWNLCRTHYRVDHPRWIEHVGTAEWEEIPEYMEHLRSGYHRVVSAMQAVLNPHIANWRDLNHGEHDIDVTEICVIGAAPDTPAGEIWDQATIAGEEAARRHISELTAGRGDPMVAVAAQIRALARQAGVGMTGQLEIPQCEPSMERG